MGQRILLSALLSALVAALVALVTARERTTAFAATRGGLQAEARPLVIYVTAHAHSSVEKAALLAGFGRENVRVVAHDGEYAMRPDALASAIAEDIAAGRRPCAVVCTAGTTGVTAFDPLDELDELEEGPNPDPLRPLDELDGPVVEPHFLAMRSSNSRS